MINNDIVDLQTDQTDGNINDVVDLVDSGSPVSIPTAELSATISTLAIKRLGNLSPEEAKEKYGLYYDLALQNAEDTINAELVNLKYQRMEELGELTIQEAALSGDIQTVKDVSDFTFTYDREADKLGIAEVEAANEILESGASDPDREIQLNEDANTALPSMLYSDAVADIAAEKMMLTKVVRKYADRLGLKTIPELLQTMIPLYTMNTFSQKIKTEDEFNDFWQGYDISEQINKFRSLSTQEKFKLIKSLDDFFDAKGGFDFAKYPIQDMVEMSQGQGNNLMALTYFSYLMDFADWELGLENVVHGFDMTLIGGPIAKATKATVLLANVARKIASATVQGKIALAGIVTGNRASAVDQALHIYNGVKTGGVTTDSNAALEVAELTVTKSINPLSEIGDHVGVPERIMHQLNLQEKLAEELAETSQVKFLDDIDSQKALESLSPGVKEVTLVTENLDTGLPHVDVIRVLDDKATLTEGIDGINYTIVFGNKEGHGFATAEIAENFAKQLKLEGAVVTTIEEQGTHFIKLTRPVDEATGFILPYQNIDDMSRFGGIRKWIMSPTNLVDDSSRLAAHLTSGVRENILTIGNQLVGYINKLSFTEKTGLSEVLEYGRNLEAWFDLNTLTHKFSLNEKQILAYNSVKLMDDINWKVMNSSEYSRKQRLGFKTFQIDAAKAEAIGIDTAFDALPLNTIPNAKNKTIYNITSGKYLDLSDAKQLEELQNKRYVFASLEGTRDAEKLSAVQYIVGSPDQLKMKPLSFDQVPYIAGGRIEYTGTHFVKQGRIRRTEAKVPILLKSRTHGVGSQGEAIAWAEKMEAGREIALQAIGPTGKIVATVDQDKAIQQATGGLYSSVDDYVEYVGTKDLHMPFEVVTDSQELRSVREQVAAGVNQHPADLAEANTIQKMIGYHTRFGDHKSKRGKRKYGFDGNPAPVVNPRETAINSLSRALEIVTLDKWKARHIEKFYKTFGAVLVDSSNRTPAAHFFDTVYIKNASKEEQVLINQAKLMKTHFRSVLNTPTKVDEAIKHSVISPLVDIFQSASTKLGKPLKHETVENLKNLNPIKFARNVAYHAHLGMFNLKQPVVQLQATLLMMAANPKNGAKAAWLTSPMRLMLMSSNPETLGSIAKGAGKVIGMSGDEVKELYDILQRSGTWRMKGGSLVEQEEKLLGSQGIAQKLLDFGQIPFLESERFNKIAATMAAAMDWKAANPGMKITDDAIDIIRSQGELYVANMNRVDRSAWQHGILALPTQFWSYQARAMEMMIPEMVGGSRHFDGWQKARMATAQLGLYGVGGAASPRYGLRVRETLDELYQERYGEKLPKMMGDTIESGVIESLIGYAFDTEVAFANRAGLGISESGWGQIFTNIATGNLEELLKFDAVGLSAIAKVGRGLSDFISIINPKGIEFASIDHARIAWAALDHHLGQTISSYDTYSRAAWAVETGKWMNKQGQVTDRNVTNFEIAMGVMGLDPSDATTKRAMKQALNGERNTFRMQIDLLSKHLRYAIEADTQDQWNVYMSLRKGLIGSLPEKDKLEINSKVMRKLTQSNRTIMLNYFEKFGTNPLGRED